MVQILSYGIAPALNALRSNSQHGESRDTNGRQNLDEVSPPIAEKLLGWQARAGTGAVKR